MSNDDNRLPAEEDATETKADEPSAGRRAAITKLAYASPVVAGLLLTGKSSHAQSFNPPPPPGS